ncbi:fungal-specific transcription factor domain-containing protein [Ephemerocybe angulata]|uniref:Fungal-specific transcription factor domain-containing protein n=1 Tax=Ephemerocybe angulata TaxID=980116 RepID=A0A8H6LYQ8_9AGAR|nr:fungal-specific transcription factor domain-containing protein [Tulosesus angulatus]
MSMQVDTIPGPSAHHPVAGPSTLAGSRHVLVHEMSSTSAGGDVHAPVFNFHGLVEMKNPSFGRYPPGIMSRDRSPQALLPSPQRFAIIRALASLLIWMRGPAARQELLNQSPPKPHPDDSAQGDHRLPEPQAGATTQAPHSSFGEPMQEDVHMSLLQEIDVQSVDWQRLRTPEVYVFRMLNAMKGLPCWEPNPQGRFSGPEGVVPGDVGTYSVADGFKKTFNIWNDDEAIRSTASRSGIVYHTPEGRETTRVQVLGKGDAVTQGPSASTIFRSNSESQLSGSKESATFGKPSTFFAWTQKGTSEARFGESQKVGVKNQSLFLEGFKLDFSQEFRLRMKQEFYSNSKGGSGGFNSNTNSSSGGSGPSSFGDSSSQHSFLPPGSSGGSSAGLGGRGGGWEGQTDHGGNRAHHPGGDSLASGIRIQSFPNSSRGTSCHPCDVINEALLEVTKAPFALCHDDDWCSLASKGLLTSEGMLKLSRNQPSYSRRCLDTKLNFPTIRVQNGVALLVPPEARDTEVKSEPISTSLRLPGAEKAKMHDPQRNQLAPQPMQTPSAATKAPVLSRPRGRGTYVVQACNTCRSKKVRCDGRKPVCTTCEYSNRSGDCSWGKDILPRPTVMESLKKRLDAAEEYNAYLLSELTRCQREHDGDSWGSLIRCPGAFDSSLEDLDPTNYDESDDTDMDAKQPLHGLIAPVQRLALWEGGTDLITYGSTSVFRMYPHETQQSWRHPKDKYDLLLDGGNGSNYDPDFDWSRHLPTTLPLNRREHDKALDLLFKFATSWCLQVDPHLFLRDMYRSLRMPQTSTPPKTAHYSPMLHNALLALALAFLDDPAIRDKKVRNSLAQEAKKYIEAEASKPNLSSVNALAALATFHSSQGDQTLGFMYFGMSARMSQTLGLEVDCSEWVNLGLIDAADVRDRSWTYWTIFAQDVCWSLDVGRDFCLPAPTERDLRELPLPFIDSELDQLPFDHVPSSVPSKPSKLYKTFASTCRLLLISRRIMGLVNGVKKTRMRQSAIDELTAEIDLQLNTWKTSLPPDLEITQKNKMLATPHKLMLHVAYWGNFILLHRPYFYRSPKVAHSTDMAIDHAKLCRRASEHIMEILDVWRQVYSLRYVPTGLLQPLFAAGTIFLLSGIQATSSVRVAQKELKHCLESLKLLIQYLREIGKSWQSALNIESILRSLIEDQLKPAILRRQATPVRGRSAFEAVRERVASYSTNPPSSRLSRRAWQTGPGSPNGSRASSSSTLVNTPISASPGLSVFPLDAKVLHTRFKDDHADALYTDAQLGEMNYLGAVGEEGGQLDNPDFDTSRFFGMSGGENLSSSPFVGPLSYQAESGASLDGTFDFEMFGIGLDFGGPELALVPDSRQPEQGRELSRDTYNPDGGHVDNLSLGRVA